MHTLKRLAVVAALSSVASYASALTPIADRDLSAVSGRDGVSIAADLHVNIGSFVYTDTDAAGGSVHFNNIKIAGAIAATIDIIDNATFVSEARGINPDGSANTATTLGWVPSPGLPGFAPAGDVVKIAIPYITTTKNLSFSVDAIKMGNSNASFGSVAANDIKLQGTTVYIWAH
jgi:hypothetical protein